VKNKLMGLYRNNKKIISNFSYLSVFQLFATLSPLITYPYLIKVLGVELYGYVLFVQAIMTYLSLWVEFGFRNLGVKYIAVCGKDKLAISDVLSSILQIRFVLFLLGFFILVLVLNVLSIDKGDKLLYLFSSGVALNGILFPEFYFLGVEKVRYVTIVNILSRTITILLLFIVVRSPEDYLLVPLMNFLGILIGGIFSLYIVFFVHKMTFKLQRIKSLFIYLKEALALFLSDAIISIKDRFTILFIGTFLGMGEVPVYDLGLKIVTAINKPVEALNTAILPAMSKKKDYSFLFKYLRLMFLVSFVLSVCIFLLLPWILNFFLGSTANLFSLQLMLLIPLLLSISYTLAVNYFVVFGLNKELLLGMFLTTVFYLIIVGIGFLLSILDGLLAFVIVSIAVYIFELLYRVFVLRKKKIENAIH